MDNNEELYSIKIAREQLEEMIKELTPRVSYLKTVVDSKKEHRGEYKEYAQKQALLEQLTNIRQEIVERGEQGKGFQEKKKTIKLDKKISGLEEEIKNKDELLKQYMLLRNNKYSKKIEKLQKELRDLREKQGRLQGSQMKIVDKKLKKQIKNARRDTNRSGRDKNLENAQDNNINRANRAEEYLNNFEWSNRKGVIKVAENVGKTIKYAGNVVIGLVSTAAEKMIGIYSAYLSKKDGVVDGTRKLPAKLGSAIKNKIREMYNNRTNGRGTR